MMRTVFFSIGLFVALVGTSLLFIDKIVLTAKVDDDSSSNLRGFFTGINSDRQKVVDPPDWVAFNLMSVGAITVLYSVALPKKQKVVDG